MKPLPFSRSAWIDIVAVGTVTVVTFLTAGYFDILEKLVDLSRRYERYELDEVITTLAVLALCLMVFALRRLREIAAASRELKRVNAELETSLAEIKTLRGIIPMCAYCKSIRDDEGYWQQVESYVQDNSEARFTHGICPDCVKTHFPGFTLE